MNKAKPRKKELKSRYAQVFLYAFLFFCFSLYVISSPPKILLLTLAFSVFHEAGHIICAAALGRRVRILDFSFFGLQPSLSEGSALSCLLIYLSGVWVNFTFAVIFFFCFRNTQSDFFFNCFIINALLFLYNIMPVPFSDGDGIIRSALSCFLFENIVNFIAASLNIIFSFIFFLFFSFRFFLLGEGLFSFCCSCIFLLASISNVGKG